MIVVLGPEEYLRPRWVTTSKEIKVGISDCTPEEEAKTIEMLSELIYDRRFCLVHTWQTGDFLIARWVLVGFGTSDTDFL